MVDFKKILTKIAKPAVSEIVAIQRDFLAGNGEIKYKEVENGIQLSPATIGDERGQAEYTKGFNRALGEKNIYYKNEEDVSDAEAKANAAREHTATYRIAIDPIDGTGNYSGDKTPGQERKPVNRALDELSADELASSSVRPGWGSMVAIQERQPDGDWKTVASSIYESNSADTPDNLKGKFFVAEAGKPGVSVINLQTGEEAQVIAAPAAISPKRVIEGGFPNIPGAKEAQAAIKRHVTDEGHQLLELRCTAQNALAVITGKAQGFFQGHPNLHDVLATAHLGESAGLSVLVLEKNGDQPAVLVKKGGKSDIQYPVFMAATPELAIGMAEKYIEGAGLDADKLTFRNGNWEAKSFKQLTSELHNRTTTVTREKPMMSVDEAAAKAGEILAQKSEGPNGVIAYAVVNDRKKREDGVEIPYYNPESTNPSKLAYAFFETDRVGVPVISAPGGTQDVLAQKDGHEMRIELTKEDSSKQALSQIGETDPGIKDVEALERHTVAKLIEKGWDVRLENSFEAAAREGKEEQGIDLSSAKSYIGAPQHYERKAMTKRTIQALEKDHGKLFDIANAKDLGDVAALIKKVEAQVGADNPGLRTPQNLFAVQVPVFDEIKLADSGEKIEKKIKGREGQKYREQGVLVTLDEMEHKLESAIASARDEEAKGNSFARQELVATYERLQIFKKIEAAIVKSLKAQGVPVKSSVQEALADKPDRELTELAGHATSPALPSVRELPKMQEMRR